MNDFLGPYGKATIVLMRAHFDGDLPKLKDLKKILNITDGKYFKSGGKNYAEVHKLLELLLILKKLKDEATNWRDVRSTDYLVTASQVHSNLFMSLKYTAQVLDGFNLTTQSMIELQELLDKFTVICSMRSDIITMWSNLESNQKLATEKGMSDQTILNPNFPALQALLQGYGDAQFDTVVQAIEDWYETHRWKVKANSPEPAGSEDEEPEEADAI